MPGNGDEKALKACFWSAERIAGLTERAHVHQFNSNAIRHTRSLGDLAGFSDMGIHLVRVEPGRDSTEHHFHGQDEEFLFVLSGRGEASIGETTIMVGPGDFLGFTKGSPAHSMHVPAEAGEDLVYLMGGTRSPIDVCTYPRAGLRMYRIDGEKEYAALSDVKKV
ncbi:cupin domain-containing protein [Parvibaculum sedimenti]|uniref:Cupin domain-containing protein n=1 Tax=Parvibaculum sedimenti TaxID=2608632 RepID=A0A6N6VH32_9HYPH|nr:cupin domain-containing protein [Parvibaculum sedimenti]KAB7738627.1 cupin domain-containing protein [Parvibaculum sedimenti]